MVEERVSQEPAGSRADAGAASARLQTMADTDTTVTAAGARLDTGITELNRTLGGGLVRDSFVLIGGDPGIGKSTLLLQLAAGLLAKTSEDFQILYASGEESVEQIRSRAERLGCPKSKRIGLLAENRINAIESLVHTQKPGLLIVDSLQTFVCDELEGAPGSVGQVREIASRLMKLAKTDGVAVVLVGHVTKDGALAGPKVVEHMVDTVLYFEGDGQFGTRLLRTVKNRFGSTHELGIFEMRREGLVQVANPSMLFLSERKQPVPGTAVTCTLEGTRPLMVEVQALVATSPLAMPRRTSVGLDTNKSSLIAAVLDRALELRLAQSDLFLNVAGGLKLTEPASDLAVAAALWSSATGHAIPGSYVFLGEVGLTGEVQRIHYPDLRLEEARKLGFSAAVLPAGTAEKLKREGLTTGIKLIGIARLSELSRVLDR